MFFKLSHRNYINLFFCLSLLTQLSCNKIETGDSLSKSDIEYIKKLGLLNENEKIYKFYSNFKNRNAGNFFTDKRIASYWIDDKHHKENQLSYAYYADIRSIDTIYYAGLTYSPFLLVSKSDSTQFKVYVDGKKGEIKSFFEDALTQWKQLK
jgi:hypothetical protein